MEKLVPYCILIAAIAAVGMVVLLAFSVAGQKKLFKSIISNKFTMHDLEEVNVENGAKNFTLIVSNRSMNDAAITSVGIVAGRDYFDFGKRYREQNELTDESPIVIQPRMPIRLTFDIAEVQKRIFRSFPNGKFQKIKVYVIDSAGILFEHKANNFDKIMRKAFAQGEAVWGSATTVVPEADEEIVTQLPTDAEE